MINYFKYDRTNKKFITRKSFCDDDIIRNPDGEILIIKDGWVGYQNYDNSLCIWYLQKESLYKDDVVFNTITELIKQNEQEIRIKKLERILDES